MQSDRIHRGGRSHLFNSMRSYLCCHNRVQPIIGLGSVIELCTDAEPPVYLCEVCVQKIYKADIKTHITGSLHRYNYIKSRHVDSLAAGADRTSLAWHLMKLAKAIEKKEGTGNVKVLHLDGILYKEMISKPALDGIAQVNKRFQRCTSDLRSSICNKYIKCRFGYFIGEQKDLQQLRPCTPEATSFGFELYSVTQSQCEFNDCSQTCTVQSPQPSEESPESYIGTQPLIGYIFADSANIVNKESLSVYVTGMAGLQTVTKCQSVDGEPPPCCYLCRPCSLKLLKSDIIHHLISSQHLLNYINCHHPHLLLSMDRTQRLQTIAMQLEEKEGRGQIKVTFSVSACLFSEVLERDFHWCMKMLNCGSAAEIKPKHGPLKPGSSTGDRRPSVALKWPNECIGTTIDHSHDGTLHDPIEKDPHSQQRSSRKGVHPKKAEHKKPVFKLRPSKWRMSSDYHKPL
ncbi:hypothetical protein NFI96_016387, partial [Prochilodus magdalenae]